MSIESSPIYLDASDASKVQKHVHLYRKFPFSVGSVVVSAHTLECGRLTGCGRTEIPEEEEEYCKRNNRISDALRQQLTRLRFTTKIPFKQGGRHRTGGIRSARRPEQSCKYEIFILRIYMTSSLSSPTSLQSGFV